MLSCARRKLQGDAPLEMVVQADAATIDPRYASDVYGLRVSRLVPCALVSPHEETLVPVPWLASTIDDDEGGALIVTLREGARFADGTPLTSADVVATWAAAADQS